MRAAFAEQLPVKGPLNWHVQVGKVHMIGLDTLVEGHRHGTLTDETLTYLRNALIRATELRSCWRCITRHSHLGSSSWMTSD